MNGLLVFLNILGTAAFAVSGALTAVRKRMDLLGVLLLGMTTAVGGGIIRDLILGRTPPAAFTDPLYAFIGLGAAAVVFLVLYLHIASYSTVSGRAFQKVLLVSDTIGLAVFTVVGVQAGVEAGDAGNWFLCVFLGTITGVGGGVMRDILAGDPPYIFYKHIYACASMAGALVTAACWKPLGDAAAMVVGALVVAAIRFLAIRFELNLPKIPLSS